MLKGLLSKLGVPGELVKKYDDLRAGTVEVEGRLRTEQPLESPVKGRNCAAFHYKARMEATRAIRGSTSGKRTLRAALVYAEGLVLEVDGGEIDLVAPKTEPFTGRDHEALSSGDFPGFKAKETRIAVDAHVRVRGKLRRDGERWVLKFTGLAPVEDDD